MTLKFPIRCMGCSRVISSYYIAYKNKVTELKLNKKQDINKIIYLTKENCEKSIEGEVLDSFMITQPCCRTTFLTHVDVLI